MHGEYKISVKIIAGHILKCVQFGKHFNVYFFCPLELIFSVEEDVIYPDSTS